MSIEDDNIIAAVLAAGLTIGSISTDYVVVWADKEMIARTSPAAWVIDVSLSHTMPLMDLISLLRSQSQNVDGEQTLRTTLAFVNVPSCLGFDSAEKLAGRIYQLAFDLIGPRSSSVLLGDADRVDDIFSLVRDQYVQMTREEAVALLLDFVVRNRATDLPKSLQGLAINL